MSTKIVERIVKEKVYFCDFCGISSKDTSPNNPVQTCSVCDSDVCCECMRKDGMFVHYEDSPQLCPKCVKDGLTIKTDEGDEDDEDYGLHVEIWVVDKQGKHIDTPNW